MLELLDWLSSLPDPLLYGAIALAAFAENIFPPLPADTVIALGVFVVARGTGSLPGVWAATMLGNVGGAMTMYWVGHRFGLPYMTRRFPRLFSEDAARSFASRFAAHGLTAVVVSRFLPAIRAVVPPVAGALGIGAMRTGIAMTVASGVWYGIICIVAFRMGAGVEAFLAHLATDQRIAAIAALVLALILGLFLWRRRERRS